jgi:uncharacterized membrane protein YdjX (TVP38/TMEM64 family)
MNPRAPRSAGRTVAWQLGGIAVGATALWLLGRVFPLVEYITRAQHQIGELEVWGGVLYPVLIALCNLMLLPGGILLIGSGLFFGLWWGTAVSLAGTLLGSAGAFWLARLVGRRWLLARLLDHPRWVALDRSIERHGWKIILLTQLHPLFPTSLLSYLYGVTRIPFRVCLPWVLLGQIPGLFLYAYIGTLTQHGLRLWQQRSQPTALETCIWIGGFILTGLITALLGHIALRLLEDTRTPLAPTTDAPAPEEINRAVPNLET